MADKQEKPARQPMSEELRTMAQIERMLAKHKPPARQRIAAWLFASIAQPAQQEPTEPTPLYDKVAS